MASRINGFIAFANLTGERIGKINRAPRPASMERAADRLSIMSSSAMTAHPKRLISWAILALSLGAIAYILWHNREAFALLGSAGMGVLVAILALKFAYYLVHGYRYQIVIEKCSGQNVAFPRWWRVYILGNFLNVVVPQLGNVYRGIQLKEVFGISYTHFVSTLLSVAWIGNLFNLAVVVVVLAALKPNLMLGPVQAWMIVLGLALFIALAPSGTDRVLYATKLNQRFLEWLRTKLVEVTRVSLALASDKSFLARLLTLAAVLLVMVCAQFYFAFRVVNIRIGAAELALFFALLHLTNYVQVTPGNIGLAELAYGLLSDQLGFGMAEGILVGTILRAAGYASILVLAVPMGGIGLLRSRANVGLPMGEKRKSRESGLKESAVHPDH